MIRVVLFRLELRLPAYRHAVSTIVRAWGTRGNSVSGSRLAVFSISELDRCSFHRQAKHSGLRLALKHITLLRSWAGARCDPWLARSATASMSRMSRQMITSCLTCAAHPACFFLFSLLLPFRHLDDATFPYRSRRLCAVIEGWREATLQLVCPGARDCPVMGVV